MKKHLAFFLILAVSSFAQKAGYYLEEETTTPPIFGLPGSTFISKTWITPENYRRDNGDANQSIYLHTKSAQASIVRHENKTISVMDRETMQGMAMIAVMLFGVEMDSATGLPIIPDPLFIPTNRQRMVGEWNALEYAVQKKNGGRVVFWVSSDPGVSGRLYSRLLSVMMGDRAKQYQKLFDQINQLPGYPVFIETSAFGKQVLQKLKKIDKLQIPDAVFDPPKAYKKIDLTEDEF
jgi:hypothetical protein